MDPTALLEAMRVRVLAALLVLASGCVTLPVPPQDCGALAAGPSGNAPLIPALRDDPEALLGLLLAAIGDPAVGELQSTFQGDRETFEAATAAGATATLQTQAGAFRGFWYERDGHAAAYTAAAAAKLLAPVLARLGLDLPVAQEGPVAWGHHGEESARASSSLYLAGRPVANPQRYLPQPYDWGLPLAASAALDTGGRGGHNSTDIRVDPLVVLPDPATLLDDAALAAKGEAWVACRVAGTWLEGPVEGWVDRDAWFVVDGSVAAAVLVEYGAPCPPGAWNDGLRHEATVLVDAATGAILDVEPGRWNCIGVPAPDEAVLPG
ncbi:MAG: hypothetical protein QOD77_889 [Thermoplasmata archaeon]|jgi:hypothetical protein|nr:hypothetical protein [Thermoplasmata archaeon]